MKKHKRARAAIHSRIFLGKILFRVNAALWLAMGATFVYGMVEDGNRWSAVLVALLFLMACASHLVCASLLNRNEGWVYIVIIALTLITLIPAFAGFPGFFFVTAAIINGVSLVNLIPLRTHFFGRA